MGELESVQARTIEKDDVIHVEGRILDVVSVKRGSGKIYITACDNEQWQVVNLEVSPNAEIKKQP